MTESTSQNLRETTLAERADELMDAVCDGLIPTRGELQLEVRKLLAVCANEALERAEKCAESQPLGTGPLGVAAAIRKLKAEG